MLQFTNIPARLQRTPGDEIIAVVTWQRHGT